MKRIRGACAFQEAVRQHVHTDGWEGRRLEALAIGTSTTFWPVRASRPPSCCPRSPGGCPALVDRDAPRRCEREHLDYYLDEYTFRFNRGSRHRGKLFYRLVQQAATVGPTTYSEMVQHLRGRRTGQPP